jgi:hypothetical protein
MTVPTADVRQMARVFGGPAGFWAAGLLGTDRPTDLAPAWQDRLAAVGWTVRGETPVPAVLATESIPLPPEFLSFWSHAQHRPVSLQQIEEALTTATPDATWAARSALLTALLDAGLFVAWPQILDPRWDWADLYVLPPSPPRARLMRTWPFLAPDIPYLSLDDQAAYLFTLRALALLGDPVETVQTLAREVFTTLPLIHTKVSQEPTYGLPLLCPPIGGWRVWTARTRAAWHRATHDLPHAADHLANTQAFVRHHVPLFLRGGAYMVAMQGLQEHVAVRLDSAGDQS